MRRRTLLKTGAAGILAGALGQAGAGDGRDAALPARLYLGSRDLVLPDRGPRRPQGRQHLGYLRPHSRHDRRPQHPRDRLRQLPPLSRGHRAAAAARGQGLPLLDLLAARAARGHRAARPARARLLRPRHRRAAEGRDRALGLPVPLGFAAGAAGSRRLGQSRDRRLVHRLRRADGAAARRPGHALGHVQRAAGPRDNGPRPGRARAGIARPRADGRRGASPEPRAGPRAGGAARAGRRAVQAGHGDEPAAGAPGRRTSPPTAMPPRSGMRHGTAPISIRCSAAPIRRVTCRSSKS